MEKNSGCEDVKAWLQNRLTQHSALICFDGLDEVPDAEQQRDRIKAVIEKVAETLPKARIVVTSRPYAYQRPDWQLKLKNHNRFATATLTPFSWGQIRLFVEQWYAYVGQELKPENRTGQAIHLQQRIQHNKNLRELAASPLLLTLIADLHHYRGNALPENRQLLYKEATDLLLDRWEEQRVERDQHGKISRVLQPSLQQYLQIEREELLFLLQELAYTVHTAQAQPVGTADLERSQLLNAFYDHHERLKGVHPIDQAELLRYLHERSGILIARSETVFTFPHRTFQEYLAATYLTRTKDAAFLTELVRKEPSRWREVALLTIPNRNFGVWELVRELCGKEEKPLPEGKVWSSHIAGQLLVEQVQTKFEALSESQQESYERVRQRLIAILTDTRIPPRERVLAGTHLGRLGDPRPCVCDREPELMRVEARMFLMGDDKTPHRLAYNFEIARYPVTNAQYRFFIEDGGYTAKHRDCWTESGWQNKEEGGYTIPLFWEDDRFNGENQPVVGVSWYEAFAYAAWLAKVSGKAYRLPSEAEWERAARHIDGRTYPWGHEWQEGLINSEKLGVNATSSVGAFPASKAVCGAEEMSGNVWEWCSTRAEDEKGKRYPDLYQPEDGREAPEGGVRRSLRGGSWHYDSYYCRAASRYYDPPGNRLSYGGFRVVRVPDPRAEARGENDMDGKNRETVQ